MTTFNPQQPSSAGRRQKPRPRVRQCYHLLVECADEQQQRRLYEQLKAQGLKCRVLTL